MTSDTETSALGGSPPQAQNIAVIRDFVVLGNLKVSTTYYPQRVQWSGFNNAETWGTSLATRADFQDLRGDHGNVQRIVPGENAGYVFMERAIFRMSYVGPPTVFRFDVVENDRGAAAPWSVVYHGNTMWYYALDGFQEKHGDSPSIPIGEQKIDQWFKGEIAESEIASMRGAYDPIENLVMWSYYSKTDRIHKSLVYKVETKRWSLIEAGIGFVSQFNSRYTDQDDSDVSVTTPGTGGGDPGAFGTALGNQGMTSRWPLDAGAGATSEPDSIGSVDLAYDSSTSRASFDGGKTPLIPDGGTAWTATATADSRLISANDGTTVLFNKGQFTAGAIVEADDNVVCPIIGAYSGSGVGSTSLITVDQGNGDVEVKYMGMEWGVSGGTSRTVTFSGAFPTDGAKHAIMVTFNGDYYVGTVAGGHVDGVGTKAIKLYIDFVLVGTYTGTMYDLWFTSQGHRISVFNNPVFATTTWIGTIDHAFYSSSALTAAQIAALRTAYTNSETPGTAPTVSGDFDDSTNAYVAGDTITITGIKDGQLGLFSGANYTATFKTGDISLGNRRMNITGVRPLIDADSVSVEWASKDVLMRNYAATKTTQALANTDGSAWFRASGRYHQATVRASEFDNAQGLTITYRPEGSR